MGTFKIKLCQCGNSVRVGQRNCQKCHAVKMREYRERTALERKLMRVLFEAASNYRLGVLDARYALAAGSVDRLRGKLFEAITDMENLK